MSLRKYIGRQVYSDHTAYTAYWLQKETETYLSTSSSFTPLDFSFSTHAQTESCWPAGPSKSVPEADNSRSHIKRHIPSCTTFGRGFGHFMTLRRRGDFFAELRWHWHSVAGFWAYTWTQSTRPNIKLLLSFDTSGIYWREHNSSSNCSRFGPVFLAPYALGS